MLTIAIIGAGPLGRWLALAAARAGFRVLLEDVMPATLHHAREYIRGQLSPLAPSFDQLPITFVSSIEDAVREADLAIDCVPDELESKLEILWLLDRMSPPRTVLASPTTQLSIADLAACTYRPEKCVAIAVEPREFANGLVSGIAMRITPRTSTGTVSLIQEFWRRLGIAASFEVEQPSSDASAGREDRPVT